MKNYYASNIILSFLICCLIITILIFTSPQANEFAHWFLIPLILCGIATGIDAINWFRGRLNILDPIGIVGLLSFHVFFVAPLLHVSWNSWLEPVYIPPDDWRPWLGGMAALNFLGLVIYHFVRSCIPEKSVNQSCESVWNIDPKRFLPIIYFAMSLSIVLQMMVYQQLGGISGYMEATTVEDKQDDPFQGMGMLFMISESFPVLAMILYAFYAQKHKFLKHWGFLLVALTFFVILQLLFGGLRSNRSNTIWALFSALGIIHFWIRPVYKKFIALGLVFLMSFLYLYGFYKTGGPEAIAAALQGQVSISSLEEDTGRTWDTLLLQDLGRADIQAFMLYRITRPNSDYDYAYGRTYVAAIVSMLPSIIVPDKPPRKRKESTELSFGKGTYTPGLRGVWISSKIHGITGEAMMNFGPFAIPFAFIPFSLVVIWVRRCLFTWSSLDSRLFLLPMLVNFCFIVLMNDLDNYIFFLVKNGMVPTIVIFLGSTRRVFHNKPTRLPLIN